MREQRTWSPHVHEGWAKPLVFWDKPETAASIEVTSATADEDSALAYLWRQQAEQERPAGSLYQVVGRYWWKPDGKGGIEQSTAHSRLALRFWEVEITVPFLEDGTFPPFLPTVRDWGKTPEGFEVAR